MSLVIDASVAVKWIFPDEASEVADELLTLDEELLAPELIYFEVGNVVWKRIQAGKLTVEFGRELLQEFSALPLVTADIRGLGPLAIEIAASYGRTFYDSSYLALAVSRTCLMVTADERLVNSLAGTVFAGCVRLL